VGNGGGNLFGDGTSLEPGEIRRCTADPTRPVSAWRRCPTPRLLETAAAAQRVEVLLAEVMQRI
jgi:hypothetical protein